MDKDRITGVAHQIKGTVKEAVGKVTGDAKTQAEGAAEKAAGKVQNAVRRRQGRRPRRSGEVAIGSYRGVRQKILPYHGGAFAPINGRKIWVEGSCCGCWVSPFR